MSGSSLLQPINIVMKPHETEIYKFKIAAFRLESLLSMSNIYDIDTEDLVESLKEINLQVENIHKQYNIDLTTYLQEMEYLQAAFKNNNIQLYAVK